MTAMRPARPNRDIPRLDATKGQASLRSALSATIAQAIHTLLTWEDRRQQRRALFHLSDEMLKDIGLTRADVERETAKSFWMP